MTTEKLVTVAAKTHIGPKAVISGNVQESPPVKLYTASDIPMADADSIFLVNLVNALVDTGMATDLAEEILVRRIPVNYKPLVFRGEKNRISEILFARNPSVQEQFKSLSLSDFLKTTAERITPADKELIKKAVAAKSRLSKFNKDEYLELVWDHPDYAAERLYIYELLVAQKKISPQIVQAAFKELVG